MFVTSISVLVAVAFGFGSSNSINASMKISEGHISDKMFAFIHGGEDARMNFTDAEEFCSNFTFHRNNSDSHLASIQNLKEVKLIQNWILNLERKSFWIGGEIICSMNALLEKMFLLHWINNDKVEFTNFKVPNYNVKNMKVTEKRCVSVDLQDGRWGVHHCSEKKYFLCLTKNQLVTEKDVVVDNNFITSSSVPKTTPMLAKLV
nr:C-type lectin Lecg [Schmidtea mediterranea]